MIHVLTKHLLEPVRPGGLFLLTNVFHPQIVTKRDTPYKFKLLITFCMGCLAWGLSRLGVEYVMMSLDEIIENQSPIHVVLAGHSPLHNPIDWGHFDFDTSDSQARINMVVSFREYTLSE